MKMNLFSILLVIAVCHNGPFALGSPVTSQAYDKIEELDNLGGNHYFQATKQVFYINTEIKNPNCTENQEPKPDPNIPADYTVTPGIGAHKFHATPKNWNDARNVCIKEGAHLIILRSADEENIVRKLQVDKNIWQTWLGIHEQFKNDDWVTVLDEPLNQVEFAPWLKGEPNHLNQKEHCVGYIKSDNNVTGMNDDRCEAELPFFCKIDLQ